MTQRTSTKSRTTNETSIEAAINLDGSGDSTISTGIGFLDHMLNALARHSGIDITLTCNGDLGVDDHHTAEDTALLLGACIDEALTTRAGVERFASRYAPLDESLARCVIDLSGRPYSYVELGFTRDTIGAIATENITHFFESLAVSMRATIHIDLIRGRNDHHKAEAAFKALAIALKDATRITRPDTVPSTKGTLE